VFDEAADRTIRKVCEGIEFKSYNEISFIEIGTDKDHMHLLITSNPAKKPCTNHKDNKEHNSEKSNCPLPPSEADVVRGVFWSSGFYNSKHIRWQVREEEYEKMYVQQIKCF